MLTTIAVFLFTRQFWRYLMLRLKSSMYGIIFFRTSSWLLQCCGHRCGLWLCVELCFSFSRETLEAEESYATLGPTRALPLQYSLSENCFFIPYATCSTVELCEFTQKLVFCAGDGVACVWHVTLLPFFVSQRCCPFSTFHEISKH